jgi:hypothetical protein
MNGNRYNNQGLCCVQYDAGVGYDEQKAKLERRLVASSQPEGLPYPTLPAHRVYVLAGVAGASITLLKDDVRYLHITTAATGSTW